MPKNDIEVTISAKDTASSILRKVADDAEALEKLDPKIVVEAADKASADLDKVIARANALDGDTAKVILEAEASKAERELKALQGHLATLDGAVAEATVTAKDQASARLDKIQSELRAIDAQSVTAEVTVDVDRGGLDKLDEVAGALPGNLGAATGALRSMSGGAAGVATGIGAAAVAGGLLADNFADAAIEAKTLSTLTGATVEESSQLTQIWTQTGADVKDLADVMLQVNGVLADSPELAKELGIEGTNVQERFMSAVEAVRDISDPLERARQGSKLFGEEGVRQVGAVISQFDDLNAAVRDREPLVTDEDAEAAIDMKRSVAELKSEVGRLATDVGRKLAPSMASLAEATANVADAAGPVLSAFSELSVLATGLGPLLGGLADGPTGFLDAMAGIPGVGRLVNHELDHMKDTLRDTGVAFDENATTIAELEASIRDTTTAGSEFVDMLTGVGDAVSGGTRSAIDEFSEAALGGLERAAQDAADAFDGLKDAMDMRASFLDAQSGADALAGSIAALGEANKIEAKTAEEVAAKAEAVSDAQLQVADDTLALEQTIYDLVAQYGEIPEEEKTKILAQLPVAEQADYRRFIDQVEGTYTTQVEAETARAEATIRTFLARMRQLRLNLGQVTLGAVGLGGMAGLHGTVTRPTTFLAGEAGPERVDITPWGQPSQTPTVGSGGGGSQQFNYTINLPRGARGDDLVATMRNHARRNGGRPKF